MKGVLKMIRVKWLVVMTLFAIVALMSCEQEAMAPYTTTVDIIQKDIEWKMQCDDSTCYPAFQGLLVHYATAVVAFPNKVAPNDPDVDQTLNDVDIRWAPTAGDLWLSGDDYKPYYNFKCYLCAKKDCPEHPKCKDVLWPLDIPYETKTDDQGISDIVWIIPFIPDVVWSTCDIQLIYDLSADIGVAIDYLRSTITIEACQQQ